MVGVLALQGNFAAHARALSRLGVDAVEVRRPEQLAGLAGLVLPGGESTTLLKFIEEEGFREPLQDFSGPMLGTCAGAILLAGRVLDPEQPSLGRIDMTIRRNGYGRQIDSFEEDGMVFIRAPIIEEVGPEVEVLREHQGRPVLVRQGKCIAATFHPELAEDPSIHSRFLSLTS